MKDSQYLTKRKRSTKLTESKIRNEHGIITTDTKEFKKGNTLKTYFSLN